jgi:ammonium transporter Rh
MQHTMIFVGFGFLYTFMREYSFSGLGFNLLLACQCIQWSTLTNWFFRVATGSIDTWDRVPLTLRSLVEGDYAAAAALIALGVVLGKANAVQLSVMALLMMPVYSLNQAICEHYLHAADAGGSMFIHTFGAVFGLAVVRPPAKTCCSSYNQNLL